MGVLREKFEASSEAAQVAGEQVQESANVAAERSRRGFVYFVTNSKNIQAVKTAAAFGIISQAVQTVAQAGSIVVPIRVTAPLIGLVLMVGVFWVADYADSHTKRWRDLVERTTGEEAAQD